MFTIKHNRTTNHIAGIHPQDTKTGEFDYAENACGSITRYALADGKRYDNIFDALNNGYEGGRKLCKTCEKAAWALVAAMDAAEVEAATPEPAEVPAEDDQTDAIDNALSNRSHTLLDAEAALQERIDANGGVWELPAVFDLDGNMVPAERYETEHGTSWRIIDAGNRGIGWFNPSKAKDPEKRRANDAKHGFYLGKVAVPVKAKLAGGNMFSVMPIVVPLDEKYSKNTAATVVDNGKGENMTVTEAAPAEAKLSFRTVHPGTGKRIVVNSPAPAKWAAWEDKGEGFEFFGLSNEGELKADAMATLPKTGKFTVSVLSPISAPNGADSAKITPDVPVDAGSATTEKETEMPPRKRAAAKPAAVKAAEAPANDNADAIQRVKDLTAQVLAIAEAGEGADVERAKELADQAEAVIGELPVNERTALRAALEEAKRGEDYTKSAAGKAPAKKSAAVAKKTAAAAATKETQDYKTSIPDAEKVVADVAAAYAAGIEAEKSNANTARTIAEKVLDARLYLSDKDGHPDYNGKSYAAKQIAGDIYAAAGANFEHTEDNEDALDRLVKSVQNLRNDVLVKRVRNITPEDAAKFFPLALKADPKADPAAAIQKFYKIPERSTWEIAAEKQRLERAARKALRAGDEKQAAELESAAKAVGKAEGEGGEAATPVTAADKRKAKHVGAIEAATEKLGGIEADLDKISGAEAADLAAQLEALIGKTSALAAMLKQK